MGEKYIYRFISYLTIDYKALEIYLEEMGQKGYELEKIGPLGFGKFRVSKPRHIRYCVEVLDDNMRKEYEGLYKTSEWQEVKAGNYIYIYKAKKDIEPTPIHKYGEIKKNQVMNTIIAREGWMVLFSILWLMWGVRELTTMNYYDLLDNMSLQSAFMKLAIGGTYSLYSIYLIIFIIKSLRKEGYEPTLKGAKYRRNVYYGIIWILLFRVINRICDGEMNLKIFVPLVAMLGAVIIITILYKKYYYNVPPKTKEKKVYIHFLYGIGIVAIIWVTFMFIITSISRASYERPLLEDEIAEAKRVGVLSLRNFPGYENAQIEWVSIDSGESFALNKYYDYRENYEGMSFSIAYYNCRNERSAQIVWDKLYDRHSDESIAYGALEKTDGSYFGADEAYKHQHWNELLLRKDDTILFIDSEEIDFYHKVNADIIKEVLNP